VSYSVKIWNFLNPEMDNASNNDIIYATSINMIQTVSVQLPLFVGKLAAPSSSLSNPMLECALSCKVNGSYIIVSSRFQLLFYLFFNSYHFYCRKSNFSVCFAVEADYPSISRDFSLFESTDCFHGCVVDFG
jgi:hypothetical protein